ncbi:MAG TPA: hypothetical protein VE988_01530 [Gemmataceae bacterium]|nr:hypothetical protein [Gemmataceae bacterium]
MTVPLADTAAQEEPSRFGDELDLWWGSYAGRAMMPSFAVCIALTVLIFFGTRLWVPQRYWFQWTFSGVASALWIVQLARWGHRFFTWNYRLTTRFLYQDRGVKPLIARRYALPTISRVEVRNNALDKWLGIGDLWICFDDTDQPAAVLKALVAPRTAAGIIREAIKKARETLT